MIIPILIVAAIGITGLSLNDQARQKHGAALAEESRMETLREAEESRIELAREAERERELELEWLREENKNDYVRGDEDAKAKLFAQREYCEKLKYDIEACWKVERTK